MLLSHDHEVSHDVVISIFSKIGIVIPSSSVTLWDLEVLMLVVEIGQSPEILMDFVIFHSSNFVKSLGKLSPDHIRNIYHLLRRWIGPESGNLGKNEQSRIRNYMRLVSNICDPKIILQVVSSKVNVEGTMYESFMVLERLLFLRYFGVSILALGIGSGKNCKLPITDIFDLDLSKSLNVLTYEENQNLEVQSISFGQILDEVSKLQMIVRESEALIVSRSISHGFDSIALLNKPQIKKELGSFSRVILEMISETLFVEMKYRTTFRSTSYKVFRSKDRSSRSESFKVTYPLSWQEVQGAASARLRMLYTKFRRNPPEIPRVIFFGFAGIDAIQRNFSQLFSSIGVDIHDRPVSSIFAEKGVEDIVEMLGRWEGTQGNSLEKFRNFLIPSYRNLGAGKLAKLVAILRCYIAYFEYNNILNTVMDGRFIFDDQRGFGIEAVNGISRVNDMIKESYNKNSKIDELPCYLTKVKSGSKYIVVDVDVFNTPYLVRKGTDEIVVIGPQWYRNGDTYAQLDPEDIQSIGGFVIENVDDFAELIKKVNFQIENGVLENSIDMHKIEDTKDIIAFFSREEEVVFSLFNYMNNHILRGLFGKLDRNYGLISMSDLNILYELRLCGVNDGVISTLWNDKMIFPLGMFESISVNFGKKSLIGVPSLRNLRFDREFYDKVMYFVKTSAIGTFRFLTSQRMSEKYLQMVICKNSQDSLILNGTTIRVVFQNARYSLFSVIPRASELRNMLESDFKFPFLRMVLKLNKDLAIELYLTRKLLGFDNKIDFAIATSCSFDQLSQSLGVKKERLETLELKYQDDFLYPYLREYLATYDTEFVVPRPKFVPGTGGLGITYQIYNDHAVITKRLLTLYDLADFQNKEGFKIFSEDKITIERGTFNQVFKVTNFHKYRKIISTYSSIVNHLEMLFEYIDKEHLEQYMNADVNFFKSVEEFWMIVVRVYLGVPSEGMKWWDEEVERFVNKLLDDNFVFQLDTEFFENSFVMSFFIGEDYANISFELINLGRTQHKLNIVSEVSNEVLVTSLLYECDLILKYNTLDGEQIKSNRIAWENIVNEKTSKTIPQVMEEQGYTNTQIDRYMKLLCENFIAPRSVVSRNSFSHLGDYEDLPISDNVIGFGKLFSHLTKVICKGSKKYKMVENFRQKVLLATDVKGLLIVAHNHFNSFGKYTKSIAR